MSNDDLKYSSFSPSEKMQSICMLRFPLHRVSATVTKKSKYFYVHISRPQHPERIYSFEKETPRMYFVIQQYLKGYCDVCQTCGEKCQEHRPLTSRPLE